MFVSVRTPALVRTQQAATTATAVVFDRVTIIDMAQGKLLPVVGHVPDSISTVTAADSGQYSLEHVLPLPCFTDRPHDRKMLIHGTTRGPAQFDAKACAAWATQLVRSHAWITPTLAVHFYVWNLYTPRLSDFFSTTQIGVSRLDSVLAIWPADATVRMQAPLIAAIGFLQKAGVPLLAGSDVMVSMAPLLGFMLQQELVFLVEAAGLTPLEALRAATLSPAKFFAATDSMGTLAPGKLADLVLLDANPLANIRNIAGIRAVVANGRYFDRSALDMLRKQAEQAWPGQR